MCVGTDESEPAQNAVWMLFTFGSGAAINNSTVTAGNRCAVLST